MDALLEAIRGDPADESRWLVLADWLADADDPRGEVVRLCAALRREKARPSASRSKQEARLRELVAAGHRHPTVTHDGPAGVRLHLLPAGWFWMGAPSSEALRGLNEYRRHVRLTRALYVGLTPVTVGQYRAVIGTVPPLAGDNDRPVTHVDEADATEFCRRLSEREPGRVYRLPTEAEWEYACRGAGSHTTAYSFGATLPPADADFDRMSVQQPDQPTAAKAVGSYPANVFGLCDMHGGVWEWCADWYDARSVPSVASTDPRGPADGTLRVVRGGCYAFPASAARAAHRSYRRLGLRRPDIGFRVVADAIPEGRP